MRHAFHWIREALLLPLAPASTVVVISSGAAVAGSPLSGGYAGSKATIRFITSYAAGRVRTRRAGHPVRVGAAEVDPGDRPRVRGGGSVRATATAASVKEYLELFGPTLDVEDVGKAAVDLVVLPDFSPGGYLLTAAGLSLLS